MTEYEFPPHPNLPPDQFKGSAQYPTSGQFGYIEASKKG